MRKLLSLASPGSIEKDRTFYIHLFWGCWKVWQKKQNDFCIILPICFSRSTEISNALFPFLPGAHTPGSLNPLQPGRMTEDLCNQIVFIKNVISVWGSAEFKWFCHRCRGKLRINSVIMSCLICLLKSLPILAGLHMDLSLQVSFHF